MKWVGKTDKIMFDDIALVIGNVKKHLFYIFKYNFIYFTNSSNNTLQYTSFYNHMNSKSTSIGACKHPTIVILVPKTSKTHFIWGFIIEKICNLATVRLHKCNFIVHRL